MGIHQIAGKGLFDAQQMFPGTYRITYDLSQPVVNIAASGSLTLDTDWIVIAGCALPKGERGSALGVLKASSVTPRILEAAKRGDYQHLLVECR